MECWTDFIKLTHWNLKVHILSFHNYKYIFFISFVVVVVIVVVAAVKTSIRKLTLIFRFSSTYFKESITKYDIHTLRVFNTYDFWFSIFKPLFSERYYIYSKTSLLMTKMHLYSLRYTFNVHSFFKTLFNVFWNVYN